MEYNRFRTILLELLRAEEESDTKRYIAALRRAISFIENNCSSSQDRTFLRGLYAQKLEDVLKKDKWAASFDELVLKEAKRSPNVTYQTGIFSVESLQTSFSSLFKKPPPAEVENNTQNRSNNVQETLKPRSVSFLEPAQKKARVEPPQDRLPTAAVLIDDRQNRIKDSRNSPISNTFVTAADALAAESIRNGFKPPSRSPPVAAGVGGKKRFVSPVAATGTSGNKDAGKAMAVYAALGMDISDVGPDAEVPELLRNVDVELI